MGRNILFIAYLYPPVGGLGLPGAQRIVKFIKYLDYDKSNILSVEPDHYPEYIELNNDIQLPVNNENIYRTGTFDVFKALLKIKQCFRHTRKYANNANNKSNSLNLNRTDSSPKSRSTEIWNEKGNSSRWQMLKDFVSNVFYFPDDASSWIVPAILRGLKIIKDDKVSVIFATGSPWSSLVVAYILSRLSSIPLVVDFRDPWMENPFHISKGKLLDSIAEKLESAIINHARLVSSNTEELRNAFIRRYPFVNHSKFITLPNGYDITDYQHIPNIHKLQHNHTISNNRLVIAHAGFLYGTRDPSPIIEAIKRVSKVQEGKVNIVFWQIGKISLNYDFYERFKDLLAENKIILIDQLPHKQCLEKLSEADVLLNIQPKTMTQVPSKLYDYLCLNLPILTVAPLDGALGNMIRHYGLGDIIDPDDINGICSCLSGLWQKKQKEDNPIADYPNRDLFDVRKIALSLSEALKKISI